jgi:Tfp pilus assembly protein PilX
MSRKNNLLKRSKPGFAIYMAFAVMMIMATMMAFSIHTNAKTSKRIVDIYVKNQAELYAKNAAEYALYRIANATTRCSPASISSFSIGDYTISVDIAYAYSNTDCTSPAKNYIALGDAPTSEREYGYVKLDVTVDVNNAQLNTEPIRIVRRYVEDITPYLH